MRILLVQPQPVKGWCSRARRFDSARGPHTFNHLPGYYRLRLRVPIPTLLHRILCYNGSQRYCHGLLVTR
jgi:hypothetical protein